MQLASIILAIVAIVVSVGSVAVGILIYRWNRTVAMKPVVVFEKTEKTEADREGWHLCNVGNGPAINIVVARRPKDSEWEEYRQCPTLAPRQHFAIQLGGAELQCDYSDIDQNRYASRCKDWVTSFPKKRKWLFWQTAEELPLGQKITRMKGLPIG